MVRQVAVVVLAVLATVDAGSIRGGSSSFLNNGEQMRPDVVANTLLSVEDEWRKLAADFTEGTDASVSKEAPSAFGKSCSTVVSAVIQGSGGDRNVAREYMGKVCSQKSLAGWRGVRCTALATSITDHAMLADNYANRQNLNPMKVCTGFWSVFVEAERNREAEEAKERAEKEKVVAEQRKKDEAVAAEAQKKAEAAAKVEAEARAKEEAHREQEEKEQKAKIDAAEAKARAAEAAARLAEKKAEAEKMQKEAAAKLEEAATAEKEHQARLEEHQTAEKALHEATKNSPPKPAVEPAAAVKPVKEVVAAPAAPKPVAAAKPAKEVAVAKEAKAAPKAAAVAEVKPVAAKVETPAKKVETPAKVAAVKK